MEKSFLVRDLAGCSVIDLQGQIFGRLVDVLPSGGNDIYVVQNETHEVLIPALVSVVKKIDLERKEILVELPAGLLEVCQKPLAPPKP